MNGNICPITIARIIYSSIRYNQAWLLSFSVLSPTKGLMKGPLQWGGDGSAEPPRGSDQGGSVFFLSAT